METQLAAQVEKKIQKQNVACVVLVVGFIGHRQKRWKSDTKKICAPNTAFRLQIHKHRKI